MQNKNNFNRHKRPNNNNNSYNSSNNRNQIFDSNGPTGRIKGSAKQISDKYASMARDAYASGENILMETLNQHSEHYFRINNYINDQAEKKRKVREDNRPSRNIIPAAKVASTTEKEEKTVAPKTETVVKTEAVSEIKADIKSEEKVVKKVRRNSTRKTKIGSVKETEEK